MFRALAYLRVLARVQAVAVSGEDFFTAARITNEISALQGNEETLRKELDQLQATGVHHSLHSVSYVFLTYLYVLRQ